MPWKSILVEEEAKYNWLDTLGRQKQVYRVTQLLEWDTGNLGQIKILEKLGFLTPGGNPRLDKLVGLADQLGYDLDIIFTKFILDLLDEKANDTDS